MRAAGSAGRVLGRRLQLQRLGAEPGPDVRAAEAVRGAAGEPSSRWPRVLNRLRGPLLGGIPGALVIPVAPPAIQGLSTFGGFQFEVLDGSGGDITQSGERRRTR